MLNILDIKEMMEKVEKAVRDNSKTLYLNAVFNDSKKIYDEQAIALAKVLMDNTFFEKLLLRSNKIGPQGGNAIAKVLEVNKTLTEIDLFNNNLGPEGCKSIAEALKINKTLNKIILSDNNLGSEGGIAIAEVLKVNKTLTSIELGNNNLGPDGGMAIIEALKFNTTLTRIELSDNNLGLKVGMAIIEALKFNKTLKIVNFISNNLSPEICKALIETLKFNKTLTGTDCFLNYSRAPKIHALLDRNRRIESILENIQTLFPGIALSLTETADSKEHSEEFDIKRYESILEDCEKLKKEYPENEMMVQEVKDEAMLALCSWDNYAPFEFRVKTLIEMVQRCQDLTLKEKALSLLSHIFFTEGAALKAQGKDKEASTLFLQAYTCGLHGLQEDSDTLNTVNAALHLWVDDKEIKKLHHIQLVLALLKLDENKFKYLKDQYAICCAILKLQPHLHLEEIHKNAFSGSASEELIREDKGLLFSRNASASSGTGQFSSSEERKFTVEHKGQQEKAVLASSSSNALSLDDDGDVMMQSALISEATSSVGSSMSSSGSAGAAGAGSGSGSQKRKA